MTDTIPETVALDELRALFTGVPAEDNLWSTTPVYTVPLAFEIAKRCDCQHEWQLRQTLYDETPVDDIPARALEVIQLAAQRYRTWRGLQTTGRGL